MRRQIGANEKIKEVSETSVKLSEFEDKVRKFKEIDPQGIGDDWMVGFVMEMLPKGVSEHMELQMSLSDKRVDICTPQENAGSVH